MEAGTPGTTSTTPVVQAPNECILNGKTSPSRAKRDLYVGLLRSRAFPVQIIWGEADPALKVTTFGEIARRAAGVEHIHRLPGKHFLQEDQSPALAELITAQARP